jgi:polyisoprenoid-binding protein YceI
LIRIYRRLASVFTVPLLICLAQVTAGQTAAHRITVHLDSARTEIHWTLKGNLHDVHGTFALKGGLVTFDPASGVAEGEVLVDATSGQSGNKSRDRRMQRDVLESNTYPQIIFHPQKVSGAVKAGGTQNVTVDGTFTIHGKDHPLTLPVQVQVTPDGQITATTQFTVPYVDWGMKNPSAFAIRVDKQVKIEVISRGTVEGLQP